MRRRCSVIASYSCYVSRLFLTVWFILWHVIYVFWHYCWWFRTPTCPRQASSLLLFGCLRACLWLNASCCHQTLLSQFFHALLSSYFVPSQHVLVSSSAVLSLWTKRERKRRRTGWTSPDKMSTKVTEQERRQGKVYKAAFFWVRQSHEWSWDFSGFCVRFHTEG